jgi:putative transposase
MSRQNYYKHHKVRKRREVDSDMLVNLVRTERMIQPRLGGRKLLHLLRPEIIDGGVKIGRDRFFDALRAYKLLIRRRHHRAITTDSRHGFRVYPNILKEAVITGPRQAVVSDITYIRTDEGFMYLSLIMDAYSRAVVGYDCSESLCVEGAMRASRMALKMLGDTVGLIHHSDRGIQYCCRDYIERLGLAGARISMTEENHCYENAAAERLNGILKQEYGLGDRFRLKSEVKGAVMEAVRLYNYRRPHQALGYRVPMEVHEAA